ncbi:hypothetical protein EV644_12076 [Kribbella orskensis]|uniref:Uncharacterized protein n=1 Tax=Kribbella orskensis TaxID=2512216 RepID=A0ABY2BB44_9ACTN|nr:MULTISPECIES: hypothetical protein [Kribbella]TCN34242.1 hypothetical protein EV642_12243 [Kribbella sp. VKM Ac-2500]TCO14452.1 hypothetical protein EV644_12076 [Kribbella orskensis]
MAVEPYDPHPHKARRQRFDPEFVAIVRIIVVMAALSVLLYMLD